MVVRQPQRGCLVVRVRHILFFLSGRGVEGGFLGLRVVSMVIVKATVCWVVCVGVWVGWMRH